MHLQEGRELEPVIFRPEVDPASAAKCAWLGAVVASLLDEPLWPALVLGLARSSRGWSQERLADEAGLTRGMIARHETSRSRIRPDRAVVLAAALEIDPAWLGAP